VSLGFGRGYSPTEHTLGTFLTPKSGSHRGVSPFLKSELKGMGTHLHLEPGFGAGGMSPTKRALQPVDSRLFEDGVLQAVNEIKATGFVCTRIWKNMTGKLLQLTHMVKYGTCVPVLTYS